MIHHKDLNENLRVCLTCNYHFRMTAEKRIEVLFGKENFKEIELEKTSDDPLNFNDKKNPNYPIYLSIYPILSYTVIY